MDRPMQGPAMKRGSCGLGSAVGINSSISGLALKSPGTRGEGGLRPPRRGSVGSDISTVHTLKFSQRATMETLLTPRQRCRVRCDLSLSRRLLEFKAKVRSMNGWTREFFGGL